jgi:acetoin utilization deacetylase AcuC-like enzyme
MVASGDLKAVDRVLQSLSAAPSLPSTAGAFGRMRTEDWLSVNNDLDMLVNHPDESGYTPLMAACSLQKRAALELATLLIENGATLETTDEEGYTALHWAAGCGNHVVLDYLCGLGANVNAQSQTGETPLHRAARMSHGECIKRLLKQGASAKIANRVGERPADVCGLMSSHLEDVPRDMKVFVGGESIRDIFAAEDKWHRVLILHHADCMNHRPSHKHQEAPERLTTILSKLTSKRHLPPCNVTIQTEFPPATSQQILAVHSSTYLRQLESLMRVLKSKQAAPRETLPLTPALQQKHVLLQRQLSFPPDRELPPPQSPNHPLAVEVEGAGAGGSASASVKVPDRVTVTPAANVDAPSLPGPSPVILPTGAAKLPAPAPLPSTPGATYTEMLDILRQMSSDTDFSVGSLPAAKRGCGAAIAAVDAVCGDKHRRAFCLTRPPGHHAGVNGPVTSAAGEGNGFCLLNTVCVAAAHALHAHPHLKRVAIVDMDVHHGQGTEEIVRARFARSRLPCAESGNGNLPADSRVVFASLHLYEPQGKDAFYPGTGGKDSWEAGIINCPLKPLWSSGGGGGTSSSSTTSTTSTSTLLPSSSSYSSSANSTATSAATAASDTEGRGPTTGVEVVGNNSIGVGRTAFLRGMEEKVIPALLAFEPDLILLSMGFDALEGDLGNAHPKSMTVGMDLHPEDYWLMTRWLCRVADLSTTGTRLVSILEGGYGISHYSPVEKAPINAQAGLNRELISAAALAHVKALAGRAL